MANKNQELREERAALVKQAREIADKYDGENNPMPSEEVQQVEERLNRADELKAQIDEFEKAEQQRLALLDRCDTELKTLSDLQDIGKNLGARGSAASPQVGTRSNGAEDLATAVDAWTRAGSEKTAAGITDHHRQAAARAGINLNANEIAINLAPIDHARQAYNNRQNGLTTLVGPDGGYSLRPSTLGGSLEHAMIQWGNMLQHATVIRTSTGENLLYPTVNDTGNEGRRLNETAALTDATDPQLNQTEIPSYGYTSDIIKVSHQLLRDSMFNVSEFVGGALGERLGRKLQTDTTTGTGASQPKGVATAAVTGKTTASTTAITADEILDLIYSVDGAYRADSKFMLNDQVIKAIRKLKDSDNQYLWQPSVQAGQPDMIFGHPVVVNNKMSSTITASDITILFGDFRKYKIRQVGVVRFKRLTELYAANDQEGFLAITEFGGNLVDAGTNPLKKLVQAAS